MDFLNFVAVWLGMRSPNAVDNKLKKAKYKAMGPTPAYHAAPQEYMKEHSGINPPENNSC
jgi:hypothetical protein